MTRICTTSFAQQRLWFLDQLEQGSPAYNLPRVFRISGLLSVEALLRTIQALVDRHESLRTMFHSDEGVPQQVILPELAVELGIVDLTERPPEEREVEVLRITGAEVRKPFNLTQAPLWRVKLLKVGPENHILVLVMHHIITDGWSMGVFFRELSDIYEAFVTGRAVHLSDLPVQYSDYSQWQRQYVAGGVVAEQVKYWNNKLAGAENVLDFPYDHPRPRKHSGLGFSKRFELDGTTTESLKVLAQRENATLFMVLLAAFCALLWRHTSQDSILLGTPTAGRNEPELEHLIGLFVNTLVLRADFSDHLTFRQLLSQIRSNTLDALAHQEVPFEKLVEALKPERTISRTPLFQVMLILQNLPRAKFELPGLLIQELEFESGIAKFDLTLEVIQLDRLYCTLEYSSDLFEPETIERLVVHFRKLLTGFVDDPDQNICLVEMLSEAEREQLHQRNYTVSEYPRELCIHTAFEQQVEQTPDAVAVVFEHREVTCRQLNERANRLARRLIAQGVMPGSLVGISIKRSPEMVVALLAILKSGAAYVPLDPSYPKERLTFLLEDSQVRCVVTDNASGSTFSQQHTDVLSIDTESVVTRDDVENPGVAVSAESRAYVIYTSGSTGTPKGVQGTHRASMNRFDWMWKAYPFEPSDTCCQKTALGFVDSIWEIFGPLLRGVRSVLVPEEVVTDSNELVRLLSEHKVTRIVLVPALLRILFDEVPNLQGKLPNLMLWSSSGETLTLELAKRFLAEFPKAKMLNIYGSSEVAADVAWHEVTSHDSGMSVPIGRPIQNVQLFVLDRILERLPVGVRGEICVGGDCLALGYWNRPELTAERFIRNPYSNDASARLFKTGDLGRYLVNGEIEYLGRADTQVKINGVRLELGEIESQLMGHPQVRTAVVVSACRIPNQQRLIAYVIASDTRTLVASDLRRYLRAKLPEAMIPSQFVFLDQIPTLPNGKVNRRTLSTLNPSFERQYVAPRTETEAKLAEIWQQVLSGEQVGIDDNFFELGGHSLMAIQVVARIRRVFEVEMPIRTLFEEPTISGLACELEKVRANGQQARRPLLSRGDNQASGSKEAILAQLQHLSAEELQKVLKQVLQDRFPKT